MTNLNVFFMSMGKLSPVNRELLNLNEYLQIDGLPSYNYFEVFDDALFKIKNCGFNTKGYLSMVLKYYIKINDKDNIKYLIDSFSSELKKNDFLELINYYSYFGNESKIIYYFSKHNNQYYYDSKSIIFLIKNNLLDVLSLLDGYFTTINSSEIFKLSKKIDNLKLVEKKNFNKLKFYTSMNGVNNKIFVETFRKFISWDFPYLDINLLNEKFAFIKNTRNIDIFNFVVLDCGNILHCLHGKITEDSYFLLFKIIEYLREKNYFPILVIHQRHLSNDKKSSKINNVIKFIKNCKEENNIILIETPFGENDDIYILILLFHFNVRVITNDRFSDHIDFLRNEFDFMKKDTFLQQITNYLDNFLIQFTVKWDYNLIFKEKQNFIKMNTLDKRITNCIQVTKNISNKKINYIIYVSDEKSNFYQLKKSINES